MAAAQTKLLFPTAQLTATTATYYTTGANTNTIVDSAIASNGTGTNRTITVYLVPSGGTADGTNVVIPALTVPANGDITLNRLILQAIPAGATLQAKSDAASAVNLRVSGREQTT